MTRTARKTITSFLFNRGIGKHARFCREAEGLSLRDMGARINMSRAAISRLETGYTDWTLYSAIEYAQALNIESSVFLSDALKGISK